MTEPFFGSNDLGINNQSKISCYEVDGVLHFEWDKEDPELIHAGINDLTPEEWSMVAERFLESWKDAPTIQDNSDGSQILIDPDGTETVLKQPTKGFKS